MRASLPWRRSSLLLANNHAQPCSTTQRTVPSPDPRGSPTWRMQVTAITGRGRLLLRGHEVAHSRAVREPMQPVRTWVADLPLNPE